MCSSGCTGAESALLSLLHLSVFVSSDDKNDLGLKMNEHTVGFSEHRFRCISHWHWPWLCALTYYVANELPILLNYYYALRGC